MTEGALVLDLLPVPLAVLRLAPDAPLPAWTSSARQFLTVSRTPQELSIVADADVVPGDLDVARDYRALRVRGPLPLHLVGVFARLAGPLADAAVPIFPIATFDTDYVLVREQHLARALLALAQAGHHVEPAPPGLSV